MSKIYLEILDNSRIQLLNKLSHFNNIGYLSGWTGLALQINHRRSYDFDIFIDQEINNKLKLKIKRIFGDVTYILDNTDQLSFKTKGIEITFLWYLFKKIKPLMQTDFLPLASISDIAADKAYTIGRRAQWRDYVDLYWLIKEKFTLKKVIKLASKNL